MSLNGIILLDKKPGITSMASDSFIKRLLQTKKVGHHGTLDPFATGLLPIFVGDALKVLRYSEDWDKSYLCEALFGAKTDTQDKDGTVTGGRLPDKEELRALRETDYASIREAFDQVSKITEQMPPKYSAKKIDGRKAYELAREGLDPELKPHGVKIYDLEIRSIKEGEDGIHVVFHTKCSKGTYIRSLCDEAGRITGFGAHAVMLRRTSVGPFRVEDALTEEQLSSLCDKGDLSFIKGREWALYGMEKTELTEEQRKDVSLGRKIKAVEGTSEGILYHAVYKGQTVAVLRRDGDIMRIDRMLLTNG